MMAPPDVINIENRQKTPDLSFDELMLTKLKRKFRKLLDDKTKEGYDSFEEFIKELKPKYYNPERCFEIYNLVRSASHPHTPTLVKSLEDRVIYKESFVCYMNAKKSRIIDDLIERYE